MNIGTRKAAMLLVCMASVAPAMAADNSFERHFQVSPGGQLTLDTDAGSVVVVGRDGHELDVHASVSGSSDFVSHFSIMAVQGPQGVTVTGRMHRLGWLGDWFELDWRRVVSDCTGERRADPAADLGRQHPCRFAGLTAAQGCRRRPPGDDPWSSAPGSPPPESSPIRITMAVMTPMIVGIDRIRNARVLSGPYCAARWLTAG